MKEIRIIEQLTFDGRTLIASDTMKLFQLVHTYFQTLGIGSTKNRNSISFAKSLGVAFLFGGSIIATSTFCFYKASTVQEFSDSIYPIVTEFACLICYFVHVSNISRTLELIDCFEKIIENSEIFYY